MKASTLSEIKADIEQRMANVLGEGHFKTMMSESPNALTEFIQDIYDEENGESVETVKDNRGTQEISYACMPENLESPTTGNDLNSSAGFYFHLTENPLMACAVRLDHMLLLTKNSPEFFLTVRETLSKGHGHKKTQNIYDCDAIRSFDARHQVIVGYGGTFAVEFFGMNNPLYKNEQKTLQRQTASGYIEYGFHIEGEPIQAQTYVLRMPDEFLNHWASRAVESGENVLSRMSMIHKAMVYPVGSIVQGPRLQDYIERPNAINCHLGDMFKNSPKWKNIFIPVDEAKAEIMKRAAKIKMQHKN